jgi:hypothetical protein
MRKMLFTSTMLVLICNVGASAQNIDVYKGGSGQFNVRENFGAKGDGVTDDTRAFQAAIDAAIASKGKLIIPPPVKFYKITNTLHVVPVTGSQVFMDIDAWGWGNGTNCIRYMGESNRAVFKILGLKQAIWTGLKVGIHEGITGMQVFDIDTSKGVESTSFVTFKNIYINLGNQPNNVGFRLGHISGGGADISNYQWENCVVLGSRLPGQIAYMVEGANTLSNTWMGGFVAFCDKIYSNKSGLGATQSRGNGGVYFHGLGGSQNNTDFEITFESTYLISGGRFESGKRFLNVPEHSLHAAITIQGCQINDYETTDGILMYMGTAGTLLIENCMMNLKGGDFRSMIVLAGNGNKGSLMVKGGAASSPKPFYKKIGSATAWRVYVEGVGKFSAPNGVFTTDSFDDERPPFKTN